MAQPNQRTNEKKRKICIQVMDEERYTNKNNQKLLEGAPIFFHSFLGNTT